MVAAEKASCAEDVYGGGGSLRVSGGGGSTSTDASGCGVRRLTERRESSIVFVSGKSALILCIVGRADGSCAQHDASSALMGGGSVVGMSRRLF